MLVEELNFDNIFIEVISLKANEWVMLIIPALGREL